MWMCQWSNRDFKILNLDLWPKTPRAHRGKEKNNVSENWTELVKILVIVWKLLGLRDPITGSIHVIPFRRESPLRA